MRLKFGSWQVDTDRRLLTHGGAPASLSPKAFDLVGELMQYENRYRLCCIRGPEGILVALAEKIG